MSEEANMGEIETRTELCEALGKACAHNGALQAELAKRLEQLQRAHDDRLGFEVRAERCRKERDEAREERAGLAEELGNARSELEHAKRLAGQAANEIEMLDGRLTVANSRVEELTRKNAELVQFVAERAEEAGRLETRLSDVHRAKDFSIRRARWQRDIARASLESCWQERQQVAEILNAVRQVSVLAANEIERLEGQRDTLQSNYQQAMDRGDELQRQLAVVSAQNRRLRENEYHSAVDAGREARREAEQQEVPQATISIRAAGGAGAGGARRTPRPEGRTEAEQQEADRQYSEMRTEAELVALAALVHLYAVRIGRGAPDAPTFAEAALDAELRRRGVLP